MDSPPEADLKYLGVKSAILGKGATSQSTVKEVMKSRLGTASATMATRQLLSIWLPCMPWAWVRASSGMTLSR
ncbi:MAG: hypothetical protein BWY83_02109 [bacterium ADurb.Bin478]|nr:MAG: hypothetical protein BWY83_02109 [bacterium ADurb.Bin478]